MKRNSEHGTTTVTTISLHNQTPFICNCLFSLSVTALLVRSEDTHRIWVEKSSTDPDKTAPKCNWPKMFLSTTRGNQPTSNCSHSNFPWSTNLTFQTRKKWLGSIWTDKIANICVSGILCESPSLGSSAVFSATCPCPLLHFKLNFWRPDLSMRKGNRRRSTVFVSYY